MKSSGRLVGLGTETVGIQREASVLLALLGGQVDLLDDAVDVLAVDIEEI